MVVKNGTKKTFEGFSKCLKCLKCSKHVSRKWIQHHRFSIYGFFTSYGFCRPK